MGPRLHHGRADRWAAVVRRRVGGRPALRDSEGPGAPDARAHGDVPAKPALLGHPVPGREPARDPRETVCSEDAKAADAAPQGRARHGAKATAPRKGRPPHAVVRGHQAAALLAPAVALAVAHASRLEQLACSATAAGTPLVIVCGATSHCRTSPCRSGAAILSDMARSSGAF